MADNELTQDDHNLINDYVKNLPYYSKLRWTAIGPDWNTVNICTEGPRICDFCKQPKARGRSATEEMTDWTCEDCFSAKALA